MVIAIEVEKHFTKSFCDKNSQQTRNRSELTQLDYGPL